MVKININIKKIILTTVLTSLCLQLCACLNGYKNGRDSDKGSGLEVWYRYKEISPAKGTPVGEITYSTSNKPDLLHEALTLLTEPPKSDTYVSAFPDSVRISSYNLSDGVLDVYLTAGYSDMSIIDRDIARCCLVMTLCALKEVDSIDIYQENTLLEQGLTASQMIIENSDSNEYEEEITLYFPGADMKSLNAEQRQLTVATSKPLTEYVIEELLKGTQNNQGGNANKSLMPEGTKLISVDTDDGLCIVNFSKEFYVNRPATSAAERLLLYSIVDTLTKLPDINSVQFKVEGETLSVYTYIDISKPFTRAEEFIKTGTDYWANGTLNVYLGTADGRITAVKVAAGSLNYEQWASSVAEYYISLDHFWGYKRVIPAGTRVLSVEASDGICRLDLSGEFMNADQNDINVAAKAIAATIYDSQAALGVIISVNGQPLFDGREIKKDERTIAD